MSADLTGVLITATADDTGGEHWLRFFVRLEDGRAAEVRITNAPPVFFVPASNDELPALNGLVRRKNVELKNQAGDPLEALYFRDQRALRDGREALRRGGWRTYESDVNPFERYLMERFLAGGVRIHGEPRIEQERLVFENPRLESASSTSGPTLLSFDIETGVSHDLLYSIALHYTGGHGTKEERLVLVNGRADARNDSVDFAIQYCPGEAALLRAFLDQVQRLDPDLLVGWNVVNFDLNYLLRKAEQLGVSLTLSRTGRKTRIVRRTGMADYAVVPGRVVVDGPQALRAAFYNFEDFSLEAVSQDLLGRGKRISTKEKREKIAEIERLYREDIAELARYNLEDCVLVTEIFRATGLVPLLLRRSAISGMLLDRIGRSSAAFDFFFLPRLHRKGFAAPDLDDVVYGNPAIGGYVMEPRGGLYRDVIVLDFRSLYPSIIRTFKIDPYSRLMSATNPVQTPTGQSFSRTEHILPEFIGELLEKRGQAKKANDPHLSMAIKILMNSFYGVMGSPGCRHYHPDLPSAITGTGQWLLIESRKHLEEGGHTVLYGDTDSLFVAMPGSAAADVSRRGNEMAADLNEYWRERLHREFDLESFLTLEYEKHFTRFFLPPARGGGAAKKRYAGLLRTEAGESLHFVGMETVRSDWTALAKDFQKELYRRVFAEEDVEEWIKDLLVRLRAGEFDGDALVYRKRLRKELEAYTKNVPQHVRAARLLENPGNEVRYFMTLRGPIPVELEPTDIDYNYYIEHQLKPIADTLLGELGLSFDGFLHPTQLSLF
ncbi:MAG: DNA polymerase II [Spirochaetales bacterium]|nr:DNA polymerase II [Leptospiraceae bacterium]MCP5483392.1 DNA polymerase II [Spirochaetales bacterium]